jgi:hypothetical protein
VVWEYKCLGFGFWIFFEFNDCLIPRLLLQKFDLLVFS